MSDHPVPVSENGHPPPENDDGENAEHHIPFFQRAPIGLFRSSPEGRCIEVNAALARMFGYSCVDEFKELVGNSTHCLYSDPSRREEMVRRVAEGGTALEFEHEFLRKDGSLFAGIVHAWSAQGPDGRMFLEGFIGDASERIHAREALEQKEKDLRVAQSLAHLGSWQWDLETGVLTGSEEWYGIYGLSPDRPVPAFEDQRGTLFTPESWDRKNAAIQEALRAGTGYVLELEAIRTDGTHIWVTARGEVVLDAQGRVVGLRGTLQDITEHKRVESELQQAKEEAERWALELESTLGALAEGLIVLDARGSIVRMNQVGNAVYGYTPAEQSMPLADRVRTVRFEDQRGAAVPTRRLPGYRALLGETVINEVYRFAKADDAPRIWLSMNAAPIRKAAGAITGAVVTFRNITDQVETEMSLRHAKEFQEKLFDTSPTAVFVLGTDGRFLSKNKACERITGHGAAEVIGRNFLEFVPGQFHAEVAELFRQVAAEGRSVIEREIPYLHKDGSTKTFLLSAAPLREAGGMTSVICSGVDISERKVLETKLTEAKEQADLANRAKSEFLANMSHEIRTPMNGILGMTDLALREDIPPRAREFLRLVDQSGKALLDIINDILDLSKIESGKVVLEDKPFGLRESLDAMFIPLSVSAGEKGLDFRHSIAPDVPDTLRGDLGRLRQILTNLIGNAVKFTEKGAVRVSVELEGSLTDPAGLLFRVEDDGIGIPGDRLEEIFLPFGQGGLSSHAKYGGTGLGLAISRELAELMGGRIRVDSEVGKGSAFSISLPFVLGEEALRGETPESAPAVQGLKTLKILLAEDNDVNQMLVTELLTRAGYEVVVAKDGSEALEALRRDRFDLVLMDAWMPELSGVEVTRKVRGGETRDPDVPIIALTAHALKGDRERFIAEGMNDYLAKPFTAKALFAVMESVGRGKGR